MTGTERFDPLGAGPAYAGRNKAARVLWRLAWLILARWTPVPFFAWRRFVLRLFGARIGRDARIYSSVSVWLPRNLAVGTSVIVGPGVILYNQGAIVIGDRTVISQRAHLCASTHDVQDPHFGLVERPIRIEPVCWIAAEAFVGPGVTVREGAVLGARAALFDDAQAWTIYRGNPAKAIARRTLRDCHDQ